MAEIRGHVGIVVLAAAMLSACMPQEKISGGINASGSDLTQTGNSAPVIHGTPPETIRVGATYYYAPSVTDAEGDEVSWSITGKPTDATFSTATGELTWKPTKTGKRTGITIIATDKKGAKTSLTFSITVEPEPTGTAALSWTPPSAYTDGTTLPASELAFYRIYHGTSEGTMKAVAEVDSRATSHTVNFLAAGTHYFAVTAVAFTGAESIYSNVGSKLIQ